MDICVQEGRKARPGLEVGICGEHGGDPSSIEWCHLIGNNYVSCSPFRVPVARLAAGAVGDQARAEEVTSRLVDWETCSQVPGSSQEPGTFVWC